VSKTVGGGGKAHLLSIEDLKEVVEAKPEVFVVGTGYNGYMKVPIEVTNFLAANNIELIVENTREAWKTFNRLAEQSKKVAAAFHLTC